MGNNLETGYMQEELTQAYISLATQEPKTLLNPDDKCYNCNYFKSTSEKNLPAEFDDSLAIFGHCTATACMKTPVGGNTIGGTE